jgi:hypothetical protein
MDAAKTRLLAKPETGAAGNGAALLLPEGKPRGTVLLSYLKGPLLSDPGDPLSGHTNRWESREIARILATLGFAVEAIDYIETEFALDKDYAAVIDIALNLQRFAAILPPTCVKILHMTTGYPRFSMAAELARVAAFEARTGRLYAPKRLTPWPDLLDRSLSVANRVSLLGNDETLSTYPTIHRGKIRCIPVSGSFLSHVRTPDELTPAKREFIWFAGPGAVHKGLDVVLEVLRRRSDLTLHIANNLAAEPDFVAAYRDVLAQDNVVYHGYMNAAHPSFRELLKDVFCFLSPSCSEGISTAAVTCLQFGLFPIASAETGVDLPFGCGLTLADCAPDTIAAAMDAALALPESDLRRQTRICQAYAHKLYSRAAFHDAMTGFLTETLGPDPRG